jgi:hypothetical protein
MFAVAEPREVWTYEERLRQLIRPNRDQADLIRTLGTFAAHKVSGEPVRDEALTAVMHDVILYAGRNA